MLLYWSEYLHDFIVLHRAHSRLLVSIQRYFSVSINQYAFIVLHQAHSYLLVSIQRYFSSVIKNDDTSVFVTSINNRFKKTMKTVNMSNNLPRPPRPPTPQYLFIDFRYLVITNEMTILWCIFIVYTATSYHHFSSFFTSNELALCSINSKVVLECP